MKTTSARWLAMTLALGLLSGAATLTAQESKPPASTTLDYTRTRWFPNLMEPYSNPLVPELRMSNSERIHSLIRDGKLRLSVEEAIALALENNLDIAVARYGPAYAQTDIVRAKSGQAIRGVAGAFTSSALFAGAIGGGVGGAAAAGGGGAGGAFGGGGAINIGSVGTFDPVVGVNFGWDRRSTPLGVTIVSGVPVVITQNSAVQSFFAQRFPTGTSYAIAVNGARQSTTSVTSVFNPQVTSSLTMGFNQPLLNGFGYRANARFLRLSRTNARIADSVFRQQVMATVSQILNLYYDLVFFRENTRVAERSLALAQKTLSDNKRQVEIGTLAPIEVVRAESEEAARQQDLIVAQTNLQQQQEVLKTALSKQVDKELGGVQIDPTDVLPEPKPEDVPPLEQALQEAVRSRPEVEQADLNLRNQEVVVKANRNALLPTLDLFATYAATGLSGAKILRAPGFPVGPVIGVEPGGIPQSLSQTLHGNFPDYSFGVTLQVPIRNRAAQADAARALLEERQLRTQAQLTLNRIAQEVRNAEIALTQAKAQIDAARKAVVLAERTLDAEQKKFQLGESTVFLVIQAQRDLVAAEVRAVQARSVYAKALTQFAQATGTTLTKHKVEVDDALTGKVTRPPNIPGA